MDTILSLAPDPSIPHTITDLSGIEAEGSDPLVAPGTLVVEVSKVTTPVEEALYLTNHAEKVTLIHRRDELRAEKILQDRLFNHSKIDTLWNKTVKEFHGSTEPTALEQILLEDTQDHSISTLKVKGAFVAIGHDPSTSRFANKIKMDKENYIITKPESTETNIPGIYAAGDVKDKIYRQAVTAAGMGCMAALEADKFIAESD